MEENSKKFEKENVQKNLEQNEQPKKKNTFILKYIVFIFILNCFIV